ncbi:MAG: hypothetical protein ACXWVS_05320 [Hyphomicrobium sp.]
MNEIAQANPLSFAADAYYAQEPLRPKEKNKEGKAEAMLRALLGSDAEARFAEASNSGILQFANIFAV